MLRKPKFHHPPHNSPLLVSALSQIKHVHTQLFSLKALYVIVFPSTHWSTKYFFVSCFPHVKPICVSLLSHPSQKSCPSYHP